MSLQPQYLVGKSAQSAHDVAAAGNAVQAGAARGELPADLQAALSAGRLPLDVLRRYLQLASVPILGVMCRAFPGRVFSAPADTAVLEHH